jgi:hypothetical protein
MGKFGKQVDSQGYVANAERSDLRHAPPAVHGVHARLCSGGGSYDHSPPGQLAPSPAHKHSPGCKAPIFYHLGPTLARLHQPAQRTRETVSEVRHHARATSQRYVHSSSCSVHDGTATATMSLCIVRMRTCQPACRPRRALYLSARTPPS